MLGVEAILLIICAGVSLIYREASAVDFLIPAAILGVLFLIFGRRSPEDRTIYGKDGMIIVSCAWILWSVFGAIPFVLSGSIPNAIDAFFETVSGFTTTGSTILTDIESLPKGMLFWRSFTHWIGGMGVLVFVMVLTSLDKKNSMYLMRAEVPGPEKDKLMPKATTTARILYAMYLVLTVIEVCALLFGGMNLFDSLIHAFGTAGTGGFSNYGASIGYFNSAYIDGVITLFMILFGINFSLYYFLLIGEFKPVWKNEELRTYLGVIFGAAVIITLNIAGQYGNPLKAFRYAIFQVASVITTTGYATADYTNWPMLSQCILLMLMVIGACASSTGGGVKVSRILMVGKSIKCEIKKMVHPKSVSIIRVNGKKISADVLRSLPIYLMAYACILVGSILLVSIDNKDFATTFSSVLTTLNNVGPGLAEVGPSGNFADFSPLAKLVFCFDMLAGRLELFPFLILFSVTGWRRKF
jgi:trk system potassium uptake protein TrkH